MTRFALTLVALAMGTPALLAQSECDGERYRYTSTYDNVSVSEGHVYGGNIDAFGTDIELDFDFYEAIGNSATDRPLLLIAHGGFFLLGTPSAPVTFPGVAGELLLDRRSLQVIPAAVDGTGRMDLSLPIGTDPSLLGLRMNVQGAFRTPQGLALTERLERPFVLR